MLDRALLLGLLSLGLVAATATAAPTRPAPAVSDLSAMPLAAAELGAGSERMILSSSSGVWKNVDVGERAAAERRSGYLLAYRDPAMTGLGRSGSVLQVATEAHLYRRPSAALRGLAGLVEDRLAMSFRTTGYARRIARTTVAGRQGSPAVVLELTITLRGQPTLFGADAYFAVGPLVGAVGVIATDRTTALDRVDLLTVRLRRRIVGVLAGGLARSPVTIPSSRPPSPAGGPRLESLALAGVDLQTSRPVTTAVVRPRFEGLASIEAQLQGGQRFLEASEQIELLGSEAAARYALSILRTWSMFNRAYTESAQVGKGTVVAVHGKPRHIALGSRTDAIAALSLDRYNGSPAIPTVSLAVRKGRLVALVFLYLPQKGSIADGEVAALVDTVRARLGGERPKPTA